MPEYLYLNEKTGEVVSVIQTMTEKHEYFKNGIEYKRIFYNPQVTLNSTSTIDPYSESDFAKKTENIKGGNIGDLMDISKEMSIKRKEKDGTDRVRNKTIKDYEKKTGKISPFREKPKSIEIDIANKKTKVKY